MRYYKVDTYSGLYIYKVSSDGLYSLMQITSRGSRKIHRAWTKGSWCWLSECRAHKEADNMRDIIELTEKQVFVEIL